MQQTVLQVKQRLVAKLEKERAVYSRIFRPSAAPVYAERCAQLCD